MTDSQIIYSIRQDRKLNRMWNGFTTVEKRKAMELADGSDWHIDQIMDDVMEERKVDRSTGSVIQF